MNTQATFGKRKPLIGPVTIAASIKGETEAQRDARIANEWQGLSGKPLPTIIGKAR